MSSHWPLALSKLAGALGCALAAALAGCASSSSTFNSTWTNPEAAPAAFAGRKVLAVVQVQEEGRRRSAEDVLAAEITRRGALGVASYKLFAASGPGQDTAAARRISEQADLAGVVIMRFIGKELSVTSTPTSTWVSDPYYRNPWGVWGHGWNTPYVTESVRTDTKVLVETRVYSLDQNLLLWAGSSETLNPTKSDDVVRELVKAVVEKMQAAKLLRTS